MNIFKDCDKKKFFSRFLSSYLLISCLAAALTGFSMTAAHAQTPKTISDPAAEVQMGQSVSVNQQDKSGLSDPSVLAAPKTDNGTTPIQPQPVTPVVTQISLSAAGDCTLGTDEKFGYEDTFPAAYDAAGNGEPFLQGVKDVFANDDLTIINLEGALTQATDRADKTFAFKGEPAYVDVLLKGSVEAATLANNHSYDYGEKGFWDTFLVLGNNGIMPFGYEESPVMKVKDVPVGLIGLNALNAWPEEQLLTELEKVKNKGAKLIVVYFHWGTELDAYPDENQRYLAHLAIDHGAHLVLGSHPHVIQGVETYKGRKICYSLGNFCFGGNSNPWDKDTMIFRQTFTFTDGKLTGNDEGQIIPCRISSTPYYNDYCPVILEGEEASRVLEKIRIRSDF
jgi:hypothetical protein